MASPLTPHSFNRVRYRSDLLKYTIEVAESGEHILAVQMLYRQYFDELLHVDTSLDVFEKEIDSLPGIYANPEGTLLLASSSTAALGCVAFKKINDEICEMKRLYIQPQFRGQGIGKSLVDKLILTAASAGYKNMRLDTLESLTAANKLYKHCGFQPCAPFGEESELDLLYFDLDLENTALI